MPNWIQASAEVDFASAKMVLTSTFLVIFIKIQRKFNVNTLFATVMVLSFIPNNTMGLTQAGRKVDGKSY
jgi:hypothetical protein